VVTGEKNSPTVAHACRKRRLKWVLGAWGYNWATQSPGDIYIWRPGPPGWGLEHRASNPVSVKNLNATEISATGKLLRPYVPARTKTSSSSSSSSSSIGCRTLFPLILHTYYTYATFPSAIDFIDFTLKMEVARSSEALLS
jgi:hypothetical protein